MFRYSWWWIFGTLGEEFWLVLFTNAIEMQNFKKRIKEYWYDNFDSKNCCWFHLCCSILNCIYFIPQTKTFRHIFILSSSIICSFAFPMACAYVLNCFDLCRVYFCFRCAFTFNWACVIIHIQKKWSRTHHTLLQYTECIKNTFSFHISHMHGIKYRNV